jgi:hypothetical protein
MVVVDTVVDMQDDCGELCDCVVRVVDFDVAWLTVTAYVGLVVILDVTNPEDVAGVVCLLDVEVLYALVKLVLDVVACGSFDLVVG